MRESTDFVDVTLFFEDVGQIEAHKVILAASKPLFLRFTRDVRGDSIVLGQYQFPGEPNGRIILFGRFETHSSDILLPMLLNTYFQYLFQVHGWFNG